MPILLVHVACYCVCQCCVHFHLVPLAFGWLALMGGLLASTASVFAFLSILDITIIMSLRYINFLFSFFRFIIFTINRVINRVSLIKLCFKII